MKIPISKELVKVKRDRKMVEDCYTTALEGTKTVHVEESSISIWESMRKLDWWVSWKR
ncbi:conserved hypothetical protein [Ricinus communis]|uniref:Uncharacterized protein n=1 Tax=Ricinus communis TaxID=3988 RepID=B9S4W9_RICCO|nr:conserved hypothetical protein [Ricinus communis]